MITAFLVIFSGISCFLSGQIYFERGLFYGISPFLPQLDKRYRRHEVKIIKNNIRKLCQPPIPPRLHSHWRFFPTSKNVSAMVQSRVLFLMEQVYCSLKRRSHLNCISDYYLIWVVISRQAVNGIMQAVKKAFERRGYSFRVKRRKTGHQWLHFSFRNTNTLQKQERKKKWLGMSFVKSCLNVAKSSMCFLSSALFAKRAWEVEGFILSGLWASVP